ncbi:PREDICTED: cytochrome b-c1 complex subunit 9 [Dufourea novaeangliae]|uniref:Complex III subunit 9 n=1 Tax=Dufourea novaeangliae TaxID=178035 RepID=A0A154PM55_DUFNO|nr:PREDICTED: cytochrome b-c1 complex subunit 9 [Dufourea novaeangliae]KZC12913.1 Cytochrome b-c1 complex subunit 9 [Dufourea novaeangliae]
MSGIVKPIYNVLFKRSSTFALTILVGSFIFERGLDVISNNIFDSVNKGRLWKDIKSKYEN